jgi:hypothetical protein
MGRKRFVTSDMSSDEKIAIVAEEHGDTAALMWPWLVTALDDWARMNANPREVKLNVFQAFSLTSTDVQAAMEACHEAGLCWLYQVDGKQYLQANPEAFYKQNTYIQEARRAHDGSAYPPPLDHPWGNFWRTSKWYGNDQQTSANFADECTSSANICNDQQEPATSVLSPSPSLSHSPTSPSESDKLSSSKRERKSEPYSPEFEEFWRCYPRNTSKQAAFRNWLTKLRNGASADKLILAAGHYTQDCQQESRPEKFIKQPATFLGPDDHWRDYLDPPKPPQRTKGGSSKGQAPDSNVILRRDAKDNAYYDHIFKKFDRVGESL